MKNVGMMMFLRSSELWCVVVSWKMCIFAVAMKNILFTIAVMVAMLLLSCAGKGETENMKTVYDFSVLNKKGEEVSLKQYEGKVLLIVNTASRCGFTPQYEELEAMYERLSGEGFEILDFPCNQFGNQSPESDEETTEFCSLNYGTKFPQFKKCEVNGENEIALYTFLKSQKGFEGFDLNSKLGPLLDKMMREADADYDKKPDVKWNFTKFLVNRKGEVVARFEPTHSMEDVEAQVKALL